MMDIIQQEDCQTIAKLSFLEWEKLKDAKVLITGSTGLIGSNLVNALAYVSNEKDLNIKLFLPVRNVTKAKEFFEWTDAEIIERSLFEETVIDEPIDYIVHLASPTESRFFVQKPVDTMWVNLAGCKNLLDWATVNPIKKFVALSTMEVYGSPEKGHKVLESEIGAFETMCARNSYPIAKIACEALCHGYYEQFGVPTVVLRATQTFGPGVGYDDNRVFAQFMRCVVEKKDIVLKTTGETERPYLYTADAVSAILLSLLKGVPGQAYTVANPDTFCSIREMAELVASKIANNTIKVKFNIEDDPSKYGYADTLHMDLSVEKIKNLGWFPTTGLVDAYINMIRGVRNTQCTK